MDDEFGIGAAAKLVQVHADALPVRVHAEGNEAIEQGKDKIEEGEDEAEERGDADELCDELAAARGEESATKRPQRPPAPWTEMAPEGSSMETASSRNSTSRGVRMPATSPAKTASRGETRPAQALEVTRPASHPLAQRLASGFPKRACVTTNVAARAARRRARY